MPLSLELKGYIKTEALVSGAFNFFINGMIVALIHHKADIVATDTASIAIDLAITCICICVLTAFFNRASLRRQKLQGSIETSNRIILFFGRLFRYPVLFGLVTGIVSAVVLFAVTSAIFVPLGILSLPFGVYIALKCLFTALFGGGITVLELYTGLFRR